MKHRTLITSICLAIAAVVTVTPSYGQFGRVAKGVAIISHGIRGMNNNKRSLTPPIRNVPRTPRVAVPRVKVPKTPKALKTPMERLSPEIKSIMQGLRHRGSSASSSTTNWLPNPSIR